MGEYYRGRCPPIVYPSSSPAVNNLYAARLSVILVLVASSYLEQNVQSYLMRIRLTVKWVLLPGEKKRETINSGDRAPEYIPLHRLLNIFNKHGV